MNIITSVTIRRPMKKQLVQMMRRKSLRRCPWRKKVGFMSVMAVMRASKPTNWKREWGVMTVLRF